MKLKLLLSSVLLYSLTSVVAKAQNPHIKDSLALVDLYNSTNGPSWRVNTNWLNGPMRTWYGVGIEKGRVVMVHLANNNISGAVPASIGNLTELTELLLSQNNLTSTLPNTLGRLTKLQDLEFSDNQLQGTIPASIGALTQLRTVHLEGNHFTGGLPTFKDVSHLAYFNAGHNEMYEKSNLHSSLSPSNCIFAIDYNRFNFNGLEMIDRIFPNANYYNQASLAIHQHGNALAVSAGGTLNNNTYDWYSVEDATKTTIKGDSTFIPAKSGKYFAVVSNAKAKKLHLRTDTVTYVASVGKADAKPLTVVIYPNPAKSSVTIKGLNENSNSKITIADATGTVWLAISSNRQAAVTCNINRLKAGNYLVYINDDGNIRTVHLLKE